VDRLLEGGKFEKETMASLHEKMEKGLSAEQLSGYRRAPELADEYRNALMLTSRLAAFQKDGNTEQYNKLFSYMTGKGDGRELLIGRLREMKAFFDPEKLKKTLGNCTDGFPKPEDVSDLVMGANVKDWDRIKISSAKASQETSYGQQHKAGLMPGM
jgi:hypothetical protein